MLHIICKSEIKTLILEHWKSDEKMPNEVFRRRMSWAYFQFWLFLAQINCQISPLKMSNIAIRQRTDMRCTNECDMQKMLRDGESNPGLPRDRRGYSPLYYRGVYLNALDFAISTFLITLWYLILKIFKILEQIDFIK